MAKKENNVLLVGAGKAGTALIKMFQEYESVNIVGVVDCDQSAPGIELAKKLDIPVAEKWDDFLSNGHLDEVINVTGDEEVHQQLNKAMPNGTLLVNSYLANAMFFLAKEYEIVDKKIQEAREEVELHEWGVKKTNESIKTLYAELEKKNVELKKLDQLKSDFLATVSHELRTPLAITKEGISLILDGALGGVSEKQAKVLSTAQSSIDRLSRLINNLLDVAKMESGKEEIHKSLISLTDTAQEVVTFFESKGSGKGLVIKAKIPEHDIEIYADHDKIIQVFTNVINNAIKFTEEGYIEIGLEDKEIEIVCSVEDTGKGVPEDEIDNMFVKFQQIDRVHGDGEKGTGLGLNIVQSIVEMHGGRIWAESEVGKGTKILFTLPKQDEEVVLREYVDKGIEIAEENDKKMSLMIVGVNKEKKDANIISDNTMCTILKDIDEVLKKNLDHCGATALKNAQECIVVLPNSSKESALSAEGKLKQAIDDYLARVKLTDQISLKFGCATFPDEAENGDTLIASARKYNF